MEKEKSQSKKNREQTSNKMVDIDTNVTITLSVFTLIIKYLHLLSGLNTQIKRYCQKSAMTT